MQAFHDEDGDYSRFSLAIPLQSKWNDFLLQSANNAQFDAEVNAVKGIGGAIRKLSRRLGNAGPAFVGWLAMLPNDAYGSIICGGFKIVINAAIRHKELCEEVFDALGEIPEAITDAQFFFKAYKSDKLHVRVAELYTRITETLHGILRFYRDRASGRHMRAAMNAFKAIAKGSNYGKRIEADIKNVRTSAFLVKHEAERCFQSRIGDMQGAQEIQTLQAARAENLLQTVYKSMQYDKSCWELRWKKLDANYTALHNEILDLKRAKTPKPVRRSGPSLRRVSELIHTSPDVTFQDLTEVLQAAPSFSTCVQTQVSDLIASPKIEDLVTSPYSCALLVHGSDGDDKISALSFVASLLVQSVQCSEDAIPLNFYCGLHTDSYRDNLVNATGMVRNLTAQLLQMRHNSLSLGFVDRKFVQNLESGSLEAVCDLFEGLIQQLPDETTLFLVVDGISFYETKDRLTDTLYAIDRMMQLVENARFVIKLLVTSPGFSSHVSRLFHQEQIYWLPDVDPEDDEGFDYNVGAFKEQVAVQARTSQMGLMRSESEYYDEL